MDRAVVKLDALADDVVDAAEDRERFDEILQKCGIPRAKGRTIYTTEEALAAAHELGYPVLVRPSYVLGGQGMERVDLNHVDIVVVQDVLGVDQADYTQVLGHVLGVFQDELPVLVLVRILGTSSDGVDAAEDRERFDEILQKCGISMPWPMRMGPEPKTRTFLRPDPSSRASFSPS